MLDGFERIKLTKGLPSISITSNGLTFNRTAVVKLGEPEYVILMKNEKDRLLAVQVCTEEEPDRTPFLSNRGKTVISVRWNNKDLIHTISKLMGWDMSNNGYRVNGDYLNDERAMVFDLKTAEKI